MGSALSRDKAVGIAGGLMGLTLVSKALGIISQMLVTYLFGTTSVADAFYFSYSLMNVVVTLIVGTVPFVLIPKYLEVLHRDGAKAAAKIGSAILTYALCFLVAQSAILFLLSTTLVGWIGKFPADRLPLVTRMFAATAPLMVPLGLAQILISLCHANKRFLVPAITGVLQSAITIVSLATLSPILGPYTLAGATGLAIFIQCLILWIHLQKAIGLVPSLRLHLTEMKDLLGGMAPLIISQIVAIIWVSLTRSVASGLPQGALSALSYAEGLKGLFLEVVVTPGAIIMLPVFAEKIARGDIRDAWDNLQTMISTVWLAACPMMVAIWLLSENMVAIVYQRGAFTARSTQLTASALVFFTIGLFAEAAHFHVSRYYIALKRTSILTFLGTAITAVCIPLMYWLAGRYGHIGIAMTHSFMVISSMVSGFLTLKFVLRLPFARHFISSTLKILAAGSAMFLAIWITKTWSSSFPIPAAAGAAAYLLIILGTGITADLPVLNNLRPSAVWTILSERRKVAL